MKRLLAWPLLGVVAVLLAGSGESRAAVQGHDRVFWLGTGDWQLCVKAGEVYLVKSHWNRSDWFRGDKSAKWFVNAPTIKARDGKFLASDPAGRRPSVHLVNKQGANTRWVFEFVFRLSPGPAKQESRFKEGPSGFIFRVKLAAGPFAGWYLAAAEPPAEKTNVKSKKPVWRPVKLVRNVKDATVFTYIEDNYFVDHK